MIPIAIITPYCFPGLQVGSQSTRNRDTTSAAPAAIRRSRPAAVERRAMRLCSYKKTFKDPAEHVQKVA